MEYTKFRGKRLDNGEWVYGSLCKLPNDSCQIAVPDEIFTQWWEFVDPKTVGQLRANTSYCQDIFEGDILSRPGYWQMVVEHYRVYPLDKVQRFNSRGVPIDEFDFDMWTVTGTIHDDAGDRP